MKYAITILLILIAVTTFFIIFNENNNPLEKNPVAEKFSEENIQMKNSQELQNELTKNLQTDEEIQQNFDCAQTQISYALRNFGTSSSCESFEEEICTSKKITCTLKVENLDAEISGNFIIKFNFLDETRNEISSSIQSDEVPAKLNKVFETEKIFSLPESQSEIICAYSTIEVPKKEVC